MGLGIQMIIDMGVDGDHVGIVDGDSASGNAVYSSCGKLFISKFFRTHFYLNPTYHLSL